MFAYHGWLVASTRLDRGLLTEHLENVGGASDLVDVRSIHDRVDIHVAGLRNRRSRSAENVLAFFDWVAEVDAEAYGLLYYLDDADERGAAYQNEFRVVIVDGGTTREVGDTLLSPVIPTIEDEFDVGTIEER